jgi:hypothetical protein
VNTAVVVFTMNIFDESLENFLFDVNWPSSYFLVYKVLTFLLIYLSFFLIISWINSFHVEDTPELQLQASRTNVALSNLAIIDFESTRVRPKSH